MRKLLSLFYVLLISVSGFALPKAIPSDCVYIGIWPGPEKISVMLKKALLPQVYQQSLQEISSLSQKTLGLDLLKDSLGKMGIDANQYLHLYLHPDKDLVAAEISARPQQFLRALKGILQKQWGSVRERKKGQVTELYTSHPSYKNHSVFLRLMADSLWISNTPQGVMLSEGIKKPVEADFYQAAQDLIKTQNPALVALVPGNLSEGTMPMDLGQDSFVALNTEGKEVYFSVLMKDPDETPKKLNLPPFFFSLPAAMVHTSLSASQILEMAEKMGNPQILYMLNSMNLKDSLGKQAFLFQGDFNALEVMQGRYGSVDLIFGFAVQMTAPYESMLEMLKNQAAAQGTSVVRSAYQGQPLYSFQQAQGSLTELHFLLLKDWVLGAVNLESLKKAADLYVSGGRSVRFPLPEENLFLFADIRRIFTQIPMLRDMLSQNGVRTDNFRILSGRYEIIEKAGTRFFLGKVSLHFND